jgi:hypothetical protein
MKIMQKTFTKETYQALCLYYAELDKIRAKYAKKHDAEKTRQAAKIKGYQTELELQNAYGDCYITRREYEAALNKLRGQEEAKTARIELLRMIYFDLKNIKAEIAEFEATHNVRKSKLL